MCKTFCIEQKASGNKSKKLEAVQYLPPAYVVRGKVMFWHASVLPSIHLSVHRGGYPYPIMLCNISQNAMGQRGGTWPGTPQPGYPLGGYLTGYPPTPGGYPGRGGTQSGTPPGGGTLAGGYPGQVPPRGVPSQVPPWGGLAPWGGTRTPPGGGKC